ncbi:MAG: thiamine diphosphokinase [Oscillospiraceae bacterium]|jgi:thiamine pyrophosphokinase
MNTCYLIGSASFDKTCLQMPLPGDFVICADGGYDHALEYGIQPDLVVGDFDSSSRNAKEIPCEVVRLQPEKDDTDMVSAARLGLQRGYRQFAIYGGFGGRFDHTYANLQLLSFLLDHGAEGTIVDGTHQIWMISGRTLVLSRKANHYLSVFSYTDQCTGVTLKGMKYPLDHAVIDSSFPIGTSNEILEAFGSITVEQGKLLVMLAPR